MNWLFLIAKQSQKMAGLHEWKCLVLPNRAHDMADALHAISDDEDFEIVGNYVESFIR